MSTYLNSTRKKWMYNFTRGGKRYAGYCTNPDGSDATTQRAADACEARLKGDVEKALVATVAEVIVPGAYTIEAMFADYVTQHAGRLRSWPTNMRRYVSELLDFFGRQTPAAAISQNDIERFIVHSRSQPRAVYVGGPRTGGVMAVPQRPTYRTDSTTNRYLITLRAAINWAVRLGKLAPLWVRRLEEPAELPNPVTIDQVNAILAHAMPHLRLAILIAVHTGLRLDETLGLRWDQVDMGRRVITLPARSTKAKTGQAVHINDDLALALDQAPHVCDSVVSYKRPSPTGKGAMVARPVKSLRRAWASAQKAAGITVPHRFHDLRATFCTAVLAANNNPVTLRAAARHASLSTTMRYAQVHDGAVKEAFNATAGLIKSQTAVANTIAPAAADPPVDGDNIKRNQ